jgi:hypothetical protein
VIRIHKRIYESWNRTKYEEIPEELEVQKRNHKENQYSWKYIVVLVRNNKKAGSTWKEL